MLVAALRRVEPRAEVVVASTREGLRHAYLDRELGVWVYPVYERMDTLEGYRRGVLGLLEKLGGVDVVHLEHEYGIFGCNPWVFEALAEARRRKLAERIVATLHTVYHHAHRRCAVAAQERLAKLGFDAVIVHNVLQEFELVNQGFNQEDIHLVPHGTLLNPYSSTPRRLLLEALGLEGLSERDGLLVLLPGFIRRDKGVDVAAKAVEGVEGVTLVVAGEPRDSEVLKAITGSRNVVVYPRYLPSDALQMLMAAADAILLPYRDVPGSYSTSGVLHLAMGSMRPVLGTRTPRLLELYEHAPSLTVPQGSVGALRSLLERLAADPLSVEREAEPLYAYAARTRWENVARLHLKLY